MSMMRQEQGLQIAVVDCARIVRPEIMFFHPSNGGARTQVEGAIFKRMGVRAGMADLVFILPAGDAAFMELKGPTGTLTEAQHRFREWAITSEVHYALIDNLPDALSKLREWYPEHTIPIA